MDGMVPQGVGVVSAVASSLDCTGKVTVLEGVNDGPEKGLSPLNPAAGPRVSTRRQGAMATKVRGVVDAGVTMGRISGPDLRTVCLSVGFGLQYKGAAQFFSGICCTVCAVTSTGRKSKGRKT